MDTGLHKLESPLRKISHKIPILLAYFIASAAAEAAATELDNQREIETVHALTQRLKENFFAGPWSPNFDVHILPDSEFIAALQELHNTKDVFSRHITSLLENPVGVIPLAFVPLTQTIFGSQKRLAFFDEHEREELWAHEIAHAYHLGYHDEFRRIFVETEQALNRVMREIDQYQQRKEIVPEQLQTNRQQLQDTYDIMTIAGEGQAVHAQAYVAEQESRRGSHTGSQGQILFDMNYGDPLVALSIAAGLCRSSAAYRQTAFQLTGNVIHRQDFDPLFENTDLREMLLRPALTEINRVRAPHILFNMMLGRHPWQHAIKHIKRVSTGHLGDQTNH